MNATDSGYSRRRPKFEYIEAKTVEEACSLLSQYAGRVKLMAGGTDLLVSMRKGKITPFHVVNIKTIPNMDYIYYGKEELHIGALATLDAIESSSLIKERFPIVGASACQVGSPQIRNVATLGGNLCNAAPSADMAPSLIGLEATAKLKGIHGERVVALEKFFIGPGQTILQEDEVLIEIEIPNPLPHTRGTYLKLPARTAIDLAVVGVAVVVTLDPRGIQIVDAKIVMGAVAPTPVRATRAEDVIRGKSVEEKLVEEAAQVASEEAAPISDVRGSAVYRKEMVRVLADRALRQVLG